MQQRTSCRHANESNEALATLNLDLTLMENYQIPECPKRLQCMPEKNEEFKLESLLNFQAVLSIEITSLEFNNF